jgi:hypothetical protein
MRENDRHRWAVVAALAMIAAPGLGRAQSADPPTLEQRVRTLERKVNAQEQKTTTEQGTVRQRIETIEKQVQEQEKAITEKLGIDFHFLLATDYLYNINNPPSNPGLNSARVFDNDANSFTVNDAALFISRTPKENENLGFMFDVDFGKTGQVVNNATWWGSSGYGTSDFFNLREAYITYKVPVGDGVTLKAGKFVTLMGEEIIKTWNNFNYNISNSILFGYAIPFTHTGLLADFPLGSMITMDLGVVNGWDDVVDNNQGKTFIGGIGITPMDAFSVYIAGTYGAEVPHNEHSKTGGLTGVFTIKATDALTFILDADWFNQSEALDQNNQPTYPIGGKSALWYGFAGYGIYKVNDDLQLSLRSEVFVDSDGTRGLNNVPNPNLATNAGTVWEITPTVSYQLTSGLLWRNEYRHDESNKQFFERSGPYFVRGQDTLATELVYAF